MKTRLVPFAVKIPRRLAADLAKCAKTLQASKADCAREALQDYADQILRPRAPGEKTNETQD